MPIRPKPFTFTCGRCGWQKTVAPKSDALGPGDWFSQCPTCANPDLKMTRASPWDAFWAETWHRH